MQSSEIFNSPQAQEFLKEIREAFLKAQRPANEVILSETDFQQFLQISKRHAATLRSEGWITYSKVGGKQYYKLSDVLNLIERHEIKSVDKRVRFSTRNHK